MTTIMRDKVLNLASRQVGYRESGNNHTKYSTYFDDPKGAWQWFGSKAQNCAWCSIFVCWLFCQNEIIGPKKARVFLGCPTPKENYAKAVPYLWKYLDARKWKVDKKSGQAGDIIFFNTSTAKCGHVGIIEKVDDKKYYTIEGNKSNQVKRCSYTRTSTTIYGLMRPNWSEIEPKEEKPVEQTPVKPAEPAIKYCRVKTITGKPLTLRKSASTKATPLANMPNNSTLIYKGEVKGTWVYGSNKWACVVYKGKTGYCTATRIKKV